jgi:hypothetical protein
LSFLKKAPGVLFVVKQGIGRKLDLAVGLAKVFCILVQRLL